MRAYYIRRDQAVLEIKDHADLEAQWLKDSDVTRMRVKYFLKIFNPKKAYRGEDFDHAFSAFIEHLRHYEVLLRDALLPNMRDVISSFNLQAVRLVESKRREFLSLESGFKLNHWFFRKKPAALDISAFREVLLSRIDGLKDQIGAHYATFSQGLPAALRQEIDLILEHHTGRVSAEWIKEVFENMMDAHHKMASFSGGYLNVPDALVEDFSEAAENWNPFELNAKI